MVGRSHVLNVNLDSERPFMRISKFLSDLSMMDDDSKKVMEPDKFICSLEDELKRIVGAEQQFPCSMLFISEAIARLKEMKMACEGQAMSKELMPCKGINNHFGSDQVISLESMAAAPNSPNDAWKYFSNASDHLPPPPSHNTCSVFTLDMLKMKINFFQSGSHQMPVHMGGESSNGQMAAAVNKANGGWKLVSEP